MEPVPPALRPLDSIAVLRHPTRGAQEHRHWAPFGRHQPLPGFEDLVGDPLRHIAGLGATGSRCWAGRPPRSSSPHHHRWIGRTGERGRTGLAGARPGPAMSLLRHAGHARGGGLTDAASAGLLCRNRYGGGAGTGGTIPRRLAARSRPSSGARPACCPIRGRHAAGAQAAPSQRRPRRKPSPVAGRIEPHPHRGPRCQTATGPQITAS